MVNIDYSCIFSVINIWNGREGVNSDSLRTYTESRIELESCIALCVPQSTLQRNDLEISSAMTADSWCRHKLSDAVLWMERSEASSRVTVGTHLFHLHLQGFTGSFTSWLVGSENFTEQKQDQSGQILRGAKHLHFQLQSIGFAGVQHLWQTKPKVSKSAAEMTCCTEGIHECHLVDWVESSQALFEKLVTLLDCLRYPTSARWLTWIELVILG